MARLSSFADVAQEPFAAAEVRRLEELRVRAHEPAVDEDLEKGRHPEVLSELDALAPSTRCANALRPADARALPLGASVGGARGLPRRRASCRGRGRRRAGRRLLRLHEAVLRAGPGARPSDDTGAQPDDRLDRPPLPPTRRPCCRCYRAARSAAVTAFGVIRVPRTRRAAGDRRELRRADRPGQRPITTQYALGKSPSAATKGGGSVWAANAADGTVSRIDRKGERRR